MARPNAKKAFDEFMSVFRASDKFDYAKELRGRAPAFEDLLEGGTIADKYGKRIPPKKGRSFAESGELIGDMLRRGDCLYVYKKGEPIPYAVQYDPETWTLKVSDKPADQMEKLEKPPVPGFFNYVFDGVVRAFGGYGFKTSRDWDAYLSRDTAVRHVTDEERIARRYRNDPVLRKNASTEDMKKYGASPKDKTEAYESLVSMIKGLGYQEDFDTSDTRTAFQQLLDSGMILDHNGEPIQTRSSGSRQEHIDYIGAALTHGRALYVIPKGEKYPREIIIDLDGKLRISRNTVDKMKQDAKEPGFWAKAFDWTRFGERNAAAMDYERSQARAAITNRIREQEQAQPEQKADAPEENKQEQPEEQKAVNAPEVEINVPEKELVNEPEKSEEKKDAQQQADKVPQQQVYADIQTGRFIQLQQLQLQQMRQWREEMSRSGAPQSDLIDKYIEDQQALLDALAASAAEREARGKDLPKAEGQKEKQNGEQEEIQDSEPEALPVNNGEKLPEAEEEKPDAAEDQAAVPERPVLSGQGDRVEYDAVNGRFVRFEMPEGSSVKDELLKRMSIEAGEKVDIRELEKNLQKPSLFKIRSEVEQRQQAALEKLQAAGLRIENAPEKAVEPVPPVQQKAERPAQEKNELVVGEGNCVEFNEKLKRFELFSNRGMDAEAEMIKRLMIRKNVDVMDSDIFSEVMDADINAANENVMSQHNAVELMRAYHLEIPESVGKVPEKEAVEPEKLDIREAKEVVDIEKHPEPNADRGLNAGAVEKKDAQRDDELDNELKDIENEVDAEYEAQKSKFSARHAHNQGRGIDEAENIAFDMSVLLGKEIPEKMKNAVRDICNEALNAKERLRTKCDELGDGSRMVHGIDADVKAIFRYACLKNAVKDGVSKSKLDTKRVKLYLNDAVFDKMSTQSNTINYYQRSRSAASLRSTVLDDKKLDGLSVTADKEMSKFINGVASLQKSSAKKIIQTEIEKQKDKSAVNAI